MKKKKKGEIPAILLWILIAVVAIVIAIIIIVGIKNKTTGDGGLLSLLP